MLFILGDLNIDLLGSDSVSNEFINMLSSYSAVPLIDRPTRVAASSATLLDLIVTSDACSKINPGIIRTDISDHFPVFCAVTDKLTSKNQRANETFYRDMKQFCTDGYSEDLFSLLTNFASTLPEIKANNFDSIFVSFSKIIADAINKHAPLNKVSRKQKTQFKTLDYQKNNDFYQKQAKDVQNSFY